jgi:hypothetical protein
MELRRKIISVVEANIGLASNCQELLEWKESIADINTDFLVTERTEEVGSDADFYIFNENKSPRINVAGNEVLARGDFIALEQEATDLRFSLLGNEGLFFRFALKVLELTHSIFSFHGCSLLEESSNQLFIICGGASSGKTAFILGGIQEGLKVFATEMTHFGFHKSDLVFYKGSLLDNIRIGSLKHNFPRARQMLEIDLPEVKDEWGTKLVADLSSYQASSHQLRNPKITLVIPHIEKERKESIVLPMENKRSLCKSLFDSASEKLGEPFLLYEKIPVLGLDSFSTSEKRLKAVQKLVDYDGLNKAVRVISGAKNCIKEIR